MRGCREDPVRDQYGVAELYSWGNVILVKENGTRELCVTVLHGAEIGGERHLQ